MFDNARINASTDNINWSTVWQNQSFYTDDVWNQQQYNISSYFTRKETARIKFSIGPTNDINRYTGWNIDNVVVIGNYISKDVGIVDWTAPLDGCGHTSEEYVNITIKNFSSQDLGICHIKCDKLLLRLESSFVNLNAVSHYCRSQEIFPPLPSSYHTPPYGTFSTLNTPFLKYG